MGKQIKVIIRLPPGTIITLIAQVVTAYSAATSSVASDDSCSGSSAVDSPFA